MNAEKRKRIGKYLIWTQVSIYVFIVLHAIAWHVLGIHVLQKLCPFAFGNHLGHFEFNGAVLFWFVVLFSTLIFGRAFCAWGCMFGAYQDFIFRMAKRLKLKPIKNIYTLWGLRIIVFAVLIGSLSKGNNDHWPTYAWFVLSIAMAGGMLWILFEKNQQGALRNDVNSLPKYIWFAQYAGGIIFWWITLNVFNEGISLAFDRNGVLDNINWVDELTIAGLIAIGIALIEKRVFCKYLCPIGMGLRVISAIPFPIKYRVRRTEEKCTKCTSCNKECLMDIKPMEEIQAHNMIKNPNCINCLVCVAKCPKNALDFTRHT